MASRSKPCCLKKKKKEKEKQNFKAAVLTSIFSAFMEPQEDEVNFELLLCEFEQGG